MKINKQLLGVRIQSIRQSKGLTMEEFGKIFGASKGVISNWESGRNIPNNDRLKRIAEFGNVTVPYLLYGSDDIVTSPQTLLDNSYANTEELFRYLDEDRQMDYAYAFDDFSRILLRCIERNDLVAFDKWVTLMKKVNYLDKDINEWKTIDKHLSLPVLTFNDYVEAQTIFLELLNQIYSNFENNETHFR